jgi:hypothetical protein
MRAAAALLEHQGRIKKTLRAASKHRVSAGYWIVAMVFIIFG